MILAVDTSLGTAIAVIDGAGTICAERAAVDPLGHVEVIGEMLAETLQDVGAEPITHVVAGMGPGPFTGLRIGIATARAVALARAITVVPVPSHFAAALTEIEADATAGRFAIVTDARRREVAVTVFEGLDADGVPHVVADTVLVLRAEAEAHLAGIRAVEVTALSAAALARVGQRALAAGRELTDGEPLYLRQPDVAQPRAPKRVGS